MEGQISLVRTFTCLTDDTFYDENNHFCSCNKNLDSIYLFILFFFRWIQIMLLPHWQDRTASCQCVMAL